MRRSCISQTNILPKQAFDDNGFRLDVYRVQG